MSTKSFSLMIAGLMMIGSVGASACGADLGEAQLQVNPEDTLVIVSAIDDKQALDLTGSERDESMPLAY